MNEMALLNSLFGTDGFGTRCMKNAYVPKVDVIQSDACYRIMMDLPGKTENDVEITLKNDLLSIASREKECKKSENPDTQEKTVYILNERVCEDCGSFRRSFTLPKDIDASKISASFKNGVLQIEIPRKEDEAEKKITIFAA